MTSSKCGCCLGAQQVVLGLCGRQVVVQSIGRHKGTKDLRPESSRVSKPCL